ncbi:MAG: hypothetical protein Tsb0032_26760 [Kiloniellaceae bacterium]
MPVSGAHSMIERPDSVRRVMAPITAMARTMAAQPSSQRPTAREGAGVAAALKAPEVVADMKRPRLRSFSPASGAADNLMGARGAAKPPATPWPVAPVRQTVPGDG